MIEFALSSNGTYDTEPTRTENGIDLIVTSLGQSLDAAARVPINQIRRAVLAEQLGYDYWFMTEHHFQPEGGEYSPNPINMEMAIAVLTKRIRLGQGANIVSWHHPLRLAEQGALLDIVSGGRVEFGAGRGYQSRETEVLGGPFGSSNQDQERNRSFYNEALDIIIKAWTEDSFRYDGEFFTIPPTYTKWDNKQTIEFFSQPGVGATVDDVLRFGDETTLRQISVLPHPIQKPYPQIWTPVTSPRSVATSARNGVNAYAVIGPTSGLKRSVAAYMKASEDAGWPDRLQPGAPFKYGWDSGRKRGFGMGRYIHVANANVGDLDKAMRRLEAEWEYYGRFGFAAALYPPGAKFDPQAKVRAHEIIEQGSAVFGSPEHVVEEILKVKDEIGYEDMLFWPHSELPGMSNAEMEEQLHVFAEEVIPVLRRELGGSPSWPESTLDFTPETHAVKT